MAAIELVDFIILYSIVNFDCLKANKINEQIKDLTFTVLFWQHKEGFETAFRPGASN